MSLSSVLIAALIAWMGAAPLQKVSTTAATPLTDADRTEIRQLVARYARALGSCSADEYAELFTPDGVFVSDDFRGARHREIYGSHGGKLEGRAALKQLVLTEDFCLKDASRPTPATQTNAGGSRPVPEVVIEPSPGGAAGRASLGGGGRYEDVYVKTADGWRFKQRTVFMPPLAGSNTSAASPR
jgi:SnoaL-like protein